MSLLTDVSVNLLATLIGVLIGSFFHFFRKRYRSAKAHAFWRPLATGELRVVLGRFREFSDFEPSGFIGVGDARALTDVGAYF